MFNDTLVRGEIAILRSLYSYSPNLFCLLFSVISEYRDCQSGVYVEYPSSDY